MIQKIKRGGEENQCLIRSFNIQLGNRNQKQTFISLFDCDSDTKKIISLSFHTSILCSDKKKPKYEKSGKKDELYLDI